MHRRRFVSSLAAAPLSLAATRIDVPSMLHEASMPDIRPQNSHGAEPEAYWRKLRADQFLLPDDLAYLNTGTLGVPPRPVLKASMDSFTDLGKFSDWTLQRWGVPVSANAESFEDLRSELARFVGCQVSELALTHNTTEGLNIVANGLDLKPGDEIVITDQEHVAGHACWENQQARREITVTAAKLALPPKRPDDIAESILAAVGPKTRVISFSGITTTTGLVMPIRQIADAARAKGIISVVDGAHLPGQVPLDIHELGCDFLAASPHKWMMAPPGCGFLYGRGDLLSLLTASVATFRWTERSLGGERLTMMGTNNGAVFKGYRAALQFIERIGADRIFARIQELAKFTYESALKLPKVHMLTPEDTRMYAGMVTFRIDGVDLRKLGPLFRRHNIWVVPGSNSLRVSTHIHTRIADLERFFTVLREGLAA